jgi:superfamily I DNA and/or RNA helicase
MSHHSFVKLSQVNLSMLNNNYKMAQEGIEFVTKHFHGHKPNP